MTTTEPDSDPWAGSTVADPAEPIVLPEGYPFEPLGVDDYPVKVGSMLLTMVDPHQGFEAAYNAISVMP